ncbi:hypothetical protein BFL38_03635 [Brachyspira hampsonii]|uniref:Uncharacterized protein n=1 Tax=Brachyspira hampsonii TaxID=1287055 RepID=A0A1E5NCM5_9SPIR|nr:hypothetical protein [Brachyspira hampsonii]OEJ13847.1 hypothetical protein BFL38_03635 [Brachyspira hampsonii]
MSDALMALSIIGICITILIIGKWVKDLILHNKQAKLKANIKDGTIEFGNDKVNAEKTIENQNKIVSNAFESPKELAVLESKNNSEILAYYHGDNEKEENKFKYDEKITSLTVYKEYSSIISQSTLKVQSQIISYIVHNHILDKDKAELREYIKAKRIEIINIYNDALSKSSIMSINKLGLENICNFYYMIILDKIEDIYKSIYNNHQAQYDKRKAFMKNLKNIPSADRLKSYDVFINNNFTETTIKDSEIVLENLEYLQKFLLGIFHDNLKYNGVR